MKMPDLPILSTLSTLCNSTATLSRFRSKENELINKQYHSFNFSLKTKSQILCSKN